MAKFTVKFVGNHTEEVEADYFDFSDVAGSWVTFRGERGDVILTLGSGDVKRIDKVT